MQVAPEPKDKLGIMTTTAFQGASAARAIAVAVNAPGGRASQGASAARAIAVAVNGPEDEPIDWSLIDWRRIEDDVRRLRQRIFSAARDQDLSKVRNLQKLMLRSRSNRSEEHTSE